MFESLQEELAFYKTLFAIACIIALISGTLFCLVLRRNVVIQRRHDTALTKLKSELDDAGKDNVRLRRVLDTPKPYPFNAQPRQVRHYTNAEFEAALTADLSDACAVCSHAKGEHYSAGPVCTRCSCDGFVAKPQPMRCEVCGTPIDKLFAGGAQVCGAGCAIAQGV